jgi:GDP-4-dehydro-6-deoxy-D-mannose reductase
VKVLVTGGGGFVAAHMVEFLREQQPRTQVFVMLRPGRPARLASFEGVVPVEADLEDPEQVRSALELTRPDRVIHLAAQSSVRHSWSDPEATWRTNVLGLLHLLEAVRAASLSPRVLVVGSSDEYGRVDADAQPVGEDAPLRPHSPYAASKVAQSFLALQYAVGHQLGVVRTRTFPHTGPGRGAVFAESSFARQIAEIEAGRARPLLRVGNLEVVRDYTDVRDVVRAYWALLDRGDSGGVYNVCSGRGVRLREMLDTLCEMAGVEVEVEVDPERLRSSDLPVMIGDPSRLRAATGWEPEYPLKRSLEELLVDWRQRVSQRVLETDEELR